MISRTILFPQLLQPNNDSTLHWKSLNHRAFPMIKSVPLYDSPTKGAEPRKLQLRIGSHSLSVTEQRLECVSSDLWLGLYEAKKALPVPTGQIIYR